MRKLKTLVIFALLLFLTGCSRNPVTGKTSLNFYSETQEIKMGEDYHPQIVDEYGGEYKNPALHNYVQDIVSRLGDVSHRPNLDYRVTLLDTPQINAFAIPGGHVYICRGLLHYINSESELAGVMGHEIGHVSAKHSVQRLSKQNGLDLGLLFGGLFMLLGGVSRETVDTVVNVGQSVGVLAILSYSREDEMEADRLGIEYSHKAGFSPQGVGRLMTMFERLGGKSDPLSTILSTHPASEIRAKQARIEVQKLVDRGGINQDMARERYLSKINGLPIGESKKYTGYLQIYTTQAGDTWESLTRKHFTAGNTDPKRLAWFNDCELKDPLPKQIKIGLF